MRNEYMTGYMASKALEKESTTKNDLAVSSELEKNSKKLEKDFGELDRISREDALMCLTGKFEIREYEPSELISIFSKRIKALPSVTPQEPFINKPCVSSGVCEHDKQKVLDKIRAEIDKIYERKGNSVDCLNALDELKWFIDKYKTESEKT